MYRERRSLFEAGDGVPSGVVERVTRINYVGFSRACSIGYTRKEEGMLLENRLEEC